MSDPRTSSEPIPLKSAVVVEVEWLAPAPLETRHALTKSTAYHFLLLSNR
jgi:hypothetical protein